MNSFFSKRTVFSIVLLSFAFLLVSSFVGRSEICCMFWAGKSYGWPNAQVVFYKVTDDYEVAQKVHTESVKYLLDNGWNTNIIWHRFILNFLVYSFISLAIVLLLKKARTLKHRQ